MHPCDSYCNYKNASNLCETCNQNTILFFDVLKTFSQSKWFTSYALTASKSLKTTELHGVYENSVQSYRQSGVGTSLLWEMWSELAEVYRTRSTTYTTENKMFEIVSVLSFLFPLSRLYFMNFVPLKHTARIIVIHYQPLNPKMGVEYQQEPICRKNQIISTFNSLLLVFLL